MFNICGLAETTNTREDPSRFWCIDKRLLSVDTGSFESLAMSAPIVAKLIQDLTGIIRNLTSKSDYVFSKTRDTFGFRVKLEQMYRSVQNSTVAWTSLENSEVLGFDFISCRNRLSVMSQMSVHIGTSIQRTPIELVDETPNLSDDNIVASIADLKMTVTAGKVKFFSGTTKNAVMSAIEDLISFDRSVETMSGFSQKVISDTRTFDKPIKELAKTETVDVNDVHAAVDSVNKRITVVNHLLNAMFLLQAYNKVMNVVFTDAISNLKEG